MLISFIQVCDGQPTKATRMMQAEEAVSRIKVKNHNKNITTKEVLNNIMVF